MDVIKRSGRRQRFSMVKLERSVDRAAREAKLTAARCKELQRDVAHGIYDSVKRRRSIRATELRTRALRRLSSRSTQTVRAWQRYDRCRRR